jgi:hypothetical protein
MPVTHDWHGSELFDESSAKGSASNSVGNLRRARGWYAIHQRRDTGILGRVGCCKVNRGRIFMRSISERDLAVVIPLLAAKIRDLTAELRATDDRLDDLTDEEVENRVQLQDLLQQYDGVLDSLRAEYEDALNEGINLPSYDTLVAR